MNSDDKDAEKLSRLQEIQTAIDTNSVGDSDSCIFTQAYVDDYTKMPDIDSEFIYLLEWINEIGYFLNGGMGAITISYIEINAWANLMQTQPTPFDVKTLRAMSQAFISMQESAKKIEEPDPLKNLQEF